MFVCLFSEGLLGVSDSPLLIATSNISSFPPCLLWASDSTFLHILPYCFALVRFLKWWTSPTPSAEKNILGQIHCFTSAEYLLTPEAYLMLKPRKHLLKPHAGLRLELSAPAKREAK